MYVISYAIHTMQCLLNIGTGSMFMIEWQISS